MNKLNEMRDREDGFTLIELLIVVLIIGILAAIAIPVYLGIQAQARQAAVQAAVNSQVTTVQVSIVENGSVPTGTSNQGDVAVVTAGDTNSFTVTGTNAKLPASYSYVYSSGTGEFSTL